MCLVYKCRNGLVPQYLAQTFSYVSDKHEHHTKAQTHQNLTLVKPKNNQLKQSFKVEYHANAKYENPYQNSGKNSMYWSKVNVSNNGEKQNTSPW